MRRAVWCVVLASACDPSPDVVARVVDAGESSDASDASVDAGDAAPPSCGAEPSKLTMIAKDGSVYDFDLATSVVTQVPLTGCTLETGAAVAKSRAGDLFIASASGTAYLVKTAESTCTRTLLVSVPSAMAFLWQPETGTERLYALFDGKLVTIDTTTFALTTVGALTPTLDDVRSLTGTIDGRLLAFAGDPEVVAVYIDPLTAAVKISTKLRSPDTGSRFVGGVPTATGFELVVGTQAWSYALATGVTRLDASLFKVDPSLVGVAGSPCAPSPK